MRVAQCSCGSVWHWSNEAIWISMDWSNEAGPVWQWINEAIDQCDSEAVEQNSAPMEQRGSGSVWLLTSVAVRQWSCRTVQQ
jgi:hypothetical protein